MKRSDSADAAAAVGALRLVAHAVSECGPVRRENQDAFQLVPLDGVGLGLVIADGMGGHSGGAEAAEAATQAAAVRLRRAARSDGWMRDVITEANTAVARVRGRLGGNPGTTMVVAVLTAGHLVVAHVGDSRAYLFRAGAARQLTADHSVTAERVRAGTLDPEKARTDPRRNYVTRALLGDPVEPDLVELELAVGDTVLLCSDGVWAMLPDSRIGELLAAATAETAARSLVDAALAAGATDNVTAVVARIESSA